METELIGDGTSSASTPPNPTEDVGKKKRTRSPNKTPRKSKGKKERKARGTRTLFYQLGYPVPGTVAEGETPELQYNDSVSLVATSKKAALREIAVAAAKPENVAGYKGAYVRVAALISESQISSETTTKVVIK